MKKILKEKVLGFVRRTSVKTAEQSANQTCLWWIHQPKLPEKVKKLRKF